MALAFSTAAAAALLASQPAPALPPAQPLFADPAPLAITLVAPVASLQRDRSGRPRPATLTVGAETLPLTVAPRGITRRKTDICQFPPLRLDLGQKPATGLFAGQKRLKLVTHCRSAEKWQQYVLLEYAAYRLFNLLTPLSFRARLATITYRDERGKNLTRVGFLIEDIDDVAARNGLQRARTGDTVPAASLSRTDAVRAVLFQYMIGNLDWSLRAGPEGEGCCHNSRLLTRTGGAPYVPVPYDFDFSGLVDAPYAVPPDEFGVESVRERKFTGLCSLRPDYLAAAADFRARRPELLGAIATIPGLQPRTRERALDYLQRFFGEIAADATMQDRILRDCVR